MAISDHSGGDVIIGFLLFAAVEYLAFRSLHMPTAIGLLWMAALVALLLWIHLRGGPRSRLASTARLRRPRISNRLGAVGLVSFLAFRAGIFVLAVAAVFAIPEVYDALLPRFQMQEGRPAATWFVLVVLVGPFIEELAFRGWIQSALQRRFHPATAVVGTSFLFMLGHGELALGAFFSGLLFGAAVLVTGSLWTGVLLHGLANLAPTLVQVLDAGSVLPLFSGTGFLAIGIACTLGGGAGLVGVLRRASRPRHVPAHYGRQGATALSG